MRCEGEVRLLSQATQRPTLPLLRLLRKPTELYADENHDHRHHNGVEKRRHEVPGLGKDAGEEFLYSRVPRQCSHQPEAAVISSTSLSSTSLLTVSPSTRGRGHHNL
jgi:hypothetical protein